jgi:hypothetical protein
MVRDIFIITTNIVGGVDVLEYAVRFNKPYVAISLLEMELGEKTAAIDF